MDQRKEYMYFICILYVITYKIHTGNICNMVYITYVISPILHIYFSVLNAKRCIIRIYHQYAYVILPKLHM